MSKWRGALETFVAECKFNRNYSDPRWCEYFKGTMDDMVILMPRDDGLEGVFLWEAVTGNYMTVYVDYRGEMFVVHMVRSEDGYLVKANLFKDFVRWGEAEYSNREGEILVQHAMLQMYMDSKVK